MKQSKVLIVIAIAIISITNLSACSNNSTTTSQKQNNIETPKEILPPGTSFSEYYKTSSLYFDYPSNKTPEELGYNILNKINVGCKSNENDPCGHYIFIISKTEIQSENQEFYLAQDSGHYYGEGYAYYGPFYDNLERILNESKESKKTW